MLIEPDCSRARNDFIAIGVDGELTLEGRTRQQMVVTFARHETTRARVGLCQAAVIGRLTGCRAKRPREDETVEEVVSENTDRSVIESNRTTDAGLHLPSPAMQPGVRSSRSKNESKETTVQRDRTERIRTYYQFRDGDAPEWHFRPEPASPFLEGPKHVPIEIVLEDEEQVGSGLLTADVHENVIVTDHLNQRFGLMKDWIIRVRLSRFQTQAVKVELKIVRNSSEQKL